MKRYSRVYASVNLDAAIENMEAMHRLLKKDTSMFAVIKTDGYLLGSLLPELAVKWIVASSVDQILID